MKARKNRWYIVSEARAKDMEIKGFAIKQKSNGKWMVLAHIRDLMANELSRKGIDLSRVEIISVE